MENIKFVYTENGKEKSSIDENKRMNEIDQLNKDLYKWYIDGKQREEVKLRWYNMIKITGKSGKSEIANAIQKYNGAEIYSYYNMMLSFENCYHINDDEYSVEEFCDFVVDNVKEKVNENDDLPLSMIVIYTNLSDISDISHLYAYVARLEEVEKLVGTVVVISQWMVYFED